MRMWRHVVTDHMAVRRAFPPRDLSRVEAAIAAGELRHRGQICVAIEGALPAGRVLKRVPPRERALEVFGLLRVWDTEENCGVLVYLLLADRDVEIVADRGIHRIVGDAAWQAICARMEAAFREGRFVDGVIAGVDEISTLLALHFPRTGEGGANELSDRPVIL
ncbi:MAG TPA: TPM domain-containing protein [Casimicrobiaceae bacterium]|nr:TPM domain-containing protein [Casimicrobiaceae bacterium]